MTWGVFLITIALYWAANSPTILGAFVRVFLILVFASASAGLMWFFVVNGAWFFILAGIGAFIFFGLVHRLLR